MSTRKALLQPFLLAAMTLTFAVVALNAAGYQVAAQGSFDRSLAVTGPVELEVSTGSGNITVRPGSSRSVQIHGMIKANNHWPFGSAEDAETKIHQLESNPPILQDGNFIRVGRIDDPELRRGISISYEIDTPAATQLKATSGSGNVQVEGVAGPVRAVTGSGNIRVSGIQNDLTANTGSGDIRANSIRGEVHLNTGSGTIDAEGVSGAFYANTGSGNITLAENTGGSGKVSTGSGSVRLSGVNGSLRVGTGSGNIVAEGQASGDWSLHTGSGNVTVRLPEDASFAINAHADSGRIITRRSVTVQGTLRKGSLEGVVGKGGPTVMLRTGSGNIQID
ncbi:MAG TPA: DUF4097 family beta strand repeat-containing protein [Terriglobia bacterium]|nr:DUF4097 family beta strand repeat-containing protein [Terriglobia bacterium]